MLPLHSLEELQNWLKSQVENIKGNFEADSVTFHLYDKQIDVLLLPVHLGLRRPDLFLRELPSMDSIVGEVVRDQKPRFVSDRLTEEAWAGSFVWTEGIQSTAILPVITTSAEVIGVLGIDYRTKHKFDEPTQTQLKLRATELGDQLSDWMTDEPLKEEIRRQRAELLQRSELQLIADRIASVISDTFVAIWLPTDSRKPEHLIVVAQKGLVSHADSGQVSLLTEPQSPVTQTFKQGTVVKKGQPDNDDFHRNLLVNARWSHIWAFPIIVSEIERVIGALCLYPVGGELTVRDQLSASVFTDLIAVTLEQTRRTRAVEALYQVASELAATPSYHRDRDFAGNITDRARQILEADEVTLHQFDETCYEFLDVKKYSVTSPRELARSLTQPRPDGETARVLREAILVSEDRVKDDLERTSVAGRFVSTIGVRLKANNEVVGALFFNYKEAHRFSTTDRDLAEIFGTYAASAIYNYRLYSENNSRLEGLQVLNEIGQELTRGILEQDKILELTHEQTSKLMDTRNMYIALYDQDMDKLSFGLAFENDERMDVKQGAYAKAAQSDGRGATRAIIESKKPLFFKTAKEAKEWYARPENEEYTGDIPERYGYIGVPMIIGEKVLGVISVRNLEADNVYNQDDLTTLSTIASQSAIALNNANLYYNVNRQLERRIEALNILHKVGQTLTSGIRLTQNKILELIYEQSSRLMDTRYMYIALYDQNTDIVSFGLALEDGVRAQLGHGTWAPRADGHGATEAIIRSKKSLLFRTAKEAEEWYARPENREYSGTIPERYGYLGVPMVVGDRVLGVIAVRNIEADNVFDQNDLTILSTIAGQAAIALDNAQLYYERVQELEGLYKLVTAVAQESDLPQVLKTIVTQTAQLLKADTVTICPYDPETKEFDQPATVFDDQPQPRPKIGGTTTKIIAAGKLIWADDTQADELWRSSEFVQSRGIKSCAATPLLVEGQCVGVLFLNYLTPHHFEEMELRLLQAVGDQAALAIAKAGIQAKRLQRINNQLATVFKLAKERRAHEDPIKYVEFILQQTVDQVPQISGTTYQSYDPDEETLTLQVASPSATAKTFSKISIQEGISGEAIRKQSKVYYSDVSAASNYLPLYSDTASELAIPLIIDLTPFGVLNFESTTKDAFSEYEIEVLERISEVAAPTIFDKFRTYALYRERAQIESEIVQARTAKSAIHTVGNKASIIRSYAIRLLNELELSDTHRQIVEKIIEQANVANTWLIKLARSSEIAQNVNIIDVIRDAIAYADLEDEIQLINEIEKIKSDLPTVYCPFNELCSTTLELIRNAQKAIKEVGGTGWIKLEVEVTEDAKFVDTLISNSGPIIPREVWKNLFAGNYRLPSRPLIGTGMGLFLARDFIESYKGVLEIIRSDETEGTTFRIRLPAQDSLEQGDMQ